MARIQDKLRKTNLFIDPAYPVSRSVLINPDGPAAADYIDKLEAVVEKVASAHFDLSLHKQHDTLTYLKTIAANALFKIKEEG